MFHHHKIFTFGLIVNPLAGLGGPAGLKGSDDPETARLAKERGVKSLVSDRVLAFINGLSALPFRFKVLTASGDMGEEYCEIFNSDHNGHSVEIVYDTPVHTSANDTYAAAKVLVEKSPDLIVFAGGDGTARDIYRAVGEHQAVLGLPAGVKMHSGVFAVTPKAATSVVESLLSGKLVAARLAEVRDIDEVAFQHDRVKTQHYGDMLIPDDQLLVQSVKCSGMLDDEIMLEELSAYMVELIEHEPDTLYILGSGGTLKHLKEGLGIDNPTLLGVDCWANGEIVARDVHETLLFELMSQFDTVKIILSIIGGQGIVLGRGNQQISPRIIRKAGLKNLQFIATQQKIHALGGRPLRVDTGDDALDRELSGYEKVICGYEDAVLYEVKYLGDQ